MFLLVIVCAFQYTVYRKNVNYTEMYRINLEYLSVPSRRMPNRIKTALFIKVSKRLQGLIQTVHVYPKFIQIERREIH